MEASLGPGHIVLHGDPAPPPRKGGIAAPHFSAHVYCDKMARLIKMPLGMEMGLGTGHIVLDGDPAPPKRGTAPIFGPCLLCPNGRPSQLLLITCTLLSTVSMVLLIVVSDQ